MIKVNISGLIFHKKYGNFPILVVMAVASVLFLSKRPSYSNNLQSLRTLALATGESPYIESFTDQFIPYEDRRDEREIRYAAFGSSVTWGASLEDREFLTYVRRITQGDSERSKNFGMRATGPNYPASCLYSMIGDEEFDVIILEYFMRSREGLGTLALRVRERFPNAIIIMTKLWGPYQFGHKEDQINLSDWAAQNGFGKDYIHDPKFREFYLQFGEGYFEYAYGDPNRNINLLHTSIAKEIGAHLIKMPYSDYADGPSGWLSIADKLLADDSFHLSKGGHAVLAAEIEMVVSKVGVPKERVVRNFRGVDHCNSWFESGVVGEGVTYSANGVLDKMPNTEKYALSFDDQDSGEGGWIAVDNPSNEVMDIFITYMTTGPPPSKYPSVSVTRTNRESMTFVLEPEAVGYGDKNVHIARLAHIGTIYPNVEKDIILFKPLEKTEYPFRLVSVVITPINRNTNERFAGYGTKYSFAS
jgi:hypothetical protein